MLMVRNRPATSIFFKIFEQEMKGKKEKMRDPLFCAMWSWVGKILSRDSRNEVFRGQAASRKAHVAIFT